MRSTKRQNKGLGALLGENVRRIRLDQNLSLTCLSNMSSIGRPFLTKVENGLSDARLSYVERLADALCVDPIALLYPHPPAIGDRPNVSKQNGRKKLGE